MFSSNTSQVAATATQAEAIDFDGTNDYLSRATDMTGNADGKTFTFSAWVWKYGASTNQAIYTTTGVKFGVFIVDGSTAVIYGINTSGTQNLVATFDIPTSATFIHILCSLDLSNTANRAIYVNDIAAAVTWTTYSNTNIDFTQTNHYVASYGATYKANGRLSNVFLDYTYRDLSVTANRRLFVTADLKPAAGQAALNPILYLPMSDPTQPGLNQGTGGNFTLTGTVARSGRGPNQYNAPYSDLDGSADYLSRTTALTGIADSNAFTVSWSGIITTTSTAPVLVFATSTTARMYVNMDDSAGGIDIGAYNSSGTVIFRAQSNSGVIVPGRNYQIVASFDLSNTANRFVYLNGQALTMTYSTYTNQNIDFAVASTPVYRVGRSAGTGYANAKLGALWFNTSYIDLSVASNLAKFVTGTGIDAKPVDLGASGELPTGTSPLIYLPMYGNNAGKNYGTGGDFTVNSGPYTGARGPNEFWGNKADFDGSTGYLARTSALSGISNSKTISCSFFYNPDASGTDQEIVSIQGSTFVWGLRVYREGSTNKLNFVAQNSSNATILNAITGSAFTTGSYFIQASFDLANTSNRSIYVNGVLDTTTWSTYTNDTASFTNRTNPVIGARLDGTYGRFLNGKLAELYFTTEYVDFKQEANRLKFRDAFGNPVDLTQQIEAAAIPNPAIYMRFPPTSFGTNSGTGGNFTVNGTITDGGQL